jgi:hypothetical protein
LLPVAVIAIAFLGVACSGPTDAVDGVASLGTNPTDTTDVADGSDGDSSANTADPSDTDPEDAMVDFARCMREHGVDIPDPQTSGGEAGGVMIEVGDDIDPEEMEAAQKACQPLMADAIGNFEPPDPEELERMQEQMLDFAKCMREHGVDFPDPVFSGDGASVQISGGAAIGPDGDGMTEAQEACQAELGGDAPFVIGIPREAP